MSRNNLSSSTVGAALVDGEGSLVIVFRFRPSFVEVEFLDPGPTPPMCGPITDHCSVEVVDIGFLFRPIWALQITWVTAEQRVLGWVVKR